MTAIPFCQRQVSGAPTASLCGGSPINATDDARQRECAANLGMAPSMRRPIEPLAVALYHGLRGLPGFDAAEDRVIEVLPETIHRLETGRRQPFELIPHRRPIILMTSLMGLSLGCDFLDGPRYAA